MGSGGLGGTDDSAQVVGVAELVAHHHQGGLPLVPGGLEDVGHTGVLPHRRHGDDALVGVGDAHGVQLAAVGFHHHNALTPGGGGDVAQGGVGFTLGDIDFIHGGAGP